MLQVLKWVSLLALGQTTCLGLNKILNYIFLRLRTETSVLLIRALLEPKLLCSNIYPLFIHDDHDKEQIRAWETKIKLRIMRKKIKYLQNGPRRMNLEITTWSHGLIQIRSLLPDANKY